MDQIVHVIIVGVFIVFVIILNLVNRMSVRGFESGRWWAWWVASWVATCVGVGILGRTIGIREIVAESDLEHAWFEEICQGRVTSIETRDAEKILGVEATVDEKINHVGRGKILSTSKESCLKTKHFREFIGEFKESLVGALFGPVAT